MVRRARAQPKLLLENGANDPDHSAGPPRLWIAWNAATDDGVVQALALAKKGEFGEALELARRAIKDFPNDPSAYLALGNVYLFKGLHDGETGADYYRPALQAFAQVAKLGDVAYGMFARGNAFTLMGFHAEAVASYGVAVRTAEETKIDIQTITAFDAALRRSALVFADKLADNMSVAESNTAVQDTSIMIDSERDLNAEAVRLGFTLESALETLRQAAAAGRETTTRAKAKPRAKDNPELRAARLKATYETLVRNSDLENPSLSLLERRRQAKHIDKTYYNLRQLIPSYRDDSEQLRLAQRELSRGRSKRGKAARQAAQNGLSPVPT